MTNNKRGMKVSTKLNLVFFMSLFVITGVQTWLRNHTDQQTAFAVSIAITILAFGILWVFTHRVITRSLSKLLSVAQQWRAGDLTAQVDLQSRDEFQQLGDTFNLLSTELNQSLKGLEKTVAERTLILQRRARQLQAAAEVGRAAVTIRDLDILLTEVTRLISIRFDVYHVGIFLLDEAGDYAILRAANSPGGKQMLQDHYRLNVEKQGLVGYVSRRGEPRIATDVETDLVHYKNPYLPETRSEIALPLSVGGKILGVLDVQSSRASVFSQEDASILQIMADQIAIAIDNAHLLAESRQALEVSRKAYGELSREIWQKFLTSQGILAYLSTKSDSGAAISPNEWYPELTVACESGEVVRAENNSIAIPITLRENVIGVFRLQKNDEEGAWTQEEIDLMQSITDQVSIALESARLYEDTQRRAERERLAGEISARMRETNNPQEILQTAVRELRQALQTNKAQVIITDSSAMELISETHDNGGDPS